MSPRLAEQFAGVVHHLHGGAAYGSRGGQLFRRTGPGLWEPLGVLPFSPKAALQSQFRLSRRLFRAGVHHLLSVDDERIVVFASKRIFTFDLRNRRFGEQVTDVVGSRPLAVCRTGNGSLFYGEYRGNAERTPVHVYGSDDGGTTWRPVRRFDGVRHIHGVFSDPFSQDLWITTGDQDDEAGIWTTSNNFGSVRCVLGGSQQVRAVQLLFTKDHVYFGSDAPDDDNWIYRWARNDGRLDQLQAINGPVFYGCHSAGQLFFATVCEPSRVNRSASAVIWRSADGERWERLMSFDKDFWPMRLFQYGQVLFPTGDPSPDTLWCTPFATSGDQISLAFEVPNPNHTPAAV